MRRIYIVLLLILCVCNVKAQSGAGDYQFSVTNNNSDVYNSEYYQHNVYLIQGILLKFNERSIKVDLKQSPTGWTYNDAYIAYDGWPILSKNSEQIEVFVGEKATENDHYGGFMLTIVYAKGSERMSLYLNVSYTQKYGFSNPVTDDRLEFKFY